MIFIHLLDFSAAHRKFRLSCTRCSSLSVRIIGEEDNPSLKKHSHSMGRCHVFWFSFFVFTIDHPSLFISSFLKFVLVTHLCLERPSRHDGFSSNLEVDYRKWQSCRNESLSNGFCLFSHFMNPRFMFPFDLPSSSLHTSFRQIVHSCIIKGGPTHQPSIHLKACPCLSHLYFSLISSMLFHGILFWLGLFPSV